MTPMHAKLEDLRYLYLACQIEDAFEGLEKGFEKHLPPVLRKQVELLFQEGPSHRRLQQAFLDLNHELAEKQAEVQPRELLIAIRDCETMARDFYRLHASRLADPNLAEVFRGMAAEEQAHLDAVERALAIAG